MNPVVQITDPSQSNAIVLPIIKSNEIQMEQKPIGRGCFGEVYRGKCRGMDVAVKVLNDINWDDSVYEEFIKEVKVMSCLLHPNILLCMGACIEAKKMIVMEYMPLGNLTSVIHGNLHLPLSKKIQYAIDICRGMAWLAARNILHRDLKPDNILLDGNGNCKVGDFGLSQIRSKNKMRDESGKIGSPYWMAPEVLLRGELDTKIDVYSFSLLFWEILTRKPLFPEYTDIDKFTNDIGKNDVRPPLDDINPVLQRILKAAWQKDPSKRPHFEQLVKLLENSIIEIYFEVCVCDAASRIHHVPPPNAKLAFRTGSWLWQTHFHGHTRVRWPQFLGVLDNLFPRESTTKTLLEKMICEKQDNEQFVSIERFYALMLWFGDVQINSTSSIYERIEQVYSKAWFFGVDTAEQSVNHLSAIAQNEGFFLVRLNMGGNISVENSPFTISHVFDRQILHTRVMFANDRTEYRFQDTTKKPVVVKNNGIIPFIEYLTQTQTNVFRVPCPRAGQVNYISCTPTSEKGKGFI